MGAGLVSISSHRVSHKVVPQTNIASTWCWETPSITWQVDLDFVCIEVRIFRVTWHPNSWIRQFWKKLAGLMWFKCPCLLTAPDLQWIIFVVFCHSFSRNFTGIKTPESDGNAKAQWGRSLECWVNSLSCGFAYLGTDTTLKTKMSMDKTHHLKMYFLLKTGGFFQFYASFPHISPRIPTDISQNRQIHMFLKISKHPWACFCWRCRNDTTQFFIIQAVEAATSKPSWQRHRPMAQIAEETWRSFEIWLNGFVIRLFKKSSNMIEIYGSKMQI